MVVWFVLLGPQRKAVVLPKPLVLLVDLLGYSGLRVSCNAFLEAAGQHLPPIGKWQREGLADEAVTRPGRGQPCGIYAK